MMTVSDEALLRDAMNMLSLHYHKIIRADLTTGEYEDIVTASPEWEAGEKFGSIFEGLSKFGAALVHPDDLQAFLDFTDEKNLRTLFDSDRNVVRFSYRRRIGVDFRWVVFEILPGTEYAPEHKIVMMYARDVQDAYGQELEYTRRLEKASYLDALTGLGSRYAYERELERVAESKSAGIGVVFMDVNGLKYVNDHRGHTEGDLLLKRMADTITGTFRSRESFRISGDEFVVLMDGIPQPSFEARMEKFYAILQNTQPPIASIGWNYCAPLKVADGLKQAETLMYKDKSKFYRSFPQMRR